MLVDNMSYYDFRGLENPNSDYTFMTQGINRDDGSVLYTDKYMFNFCRPTHRSCRDDEVTWALRERYDVGSLGDEACEHLSGTDIINSYSANIV